MNYQKPKGTNDILPGQSEQWQYVESIARMVFKRYNFHELRTPVFEHFEVIARVGESTDIVSKEMYDFYDKGNRHITLRPEGTAPLVRSYVENKLYGPEYANPFKAYYIGPMFRYERPQAGRLRQFHQIGVEVIGSSNPVTDVETMIMALDFYKNLGVVKTKLVINSLGTRTSRKKYRQVLIDYLSKFADSLSENSKRRLYQNPLRVLDSKEQQDQKIIEKAPSLLDYLDERSKEFFDEVKNLLTVAQIPFVVDHRMVRGLDYYNHTVFEIMSEAEGFGGVLTTICAGGRYDGLISELGGPDTVDTGFGFALGIERALLAIEAEKQTLEMKNTVDVYIVCLKDAYASYAQQIAQIARDANLIVEQDLSYRKLQAQLRKANKSNAKIVAIVGDQEIHDQQVLLKNMSSGEEQLIPLPQLAPYFAKS